MTERRRTTRRQTGGGRGRWWLLAVGVAVLLIGAGIGIGALVWSNDKAAPQTAQEIRPPDKITLALSAGVWHCIRDAARYGLVVTSTTGGVHAPGSYHYRSMAVDTAGSYPNMLRMQRHLWATRSKYLEVIGPLDNLGVKNGQPFRYSPALLAQHDNHVHCAR